MVELIIRGSSEEVLDFLSRFERIGEPVPCTVGEDCTKVGHGDVLKRYFAASADILDEIRKQDPGVRLFNPSICGYVSPLLYFK